MPTFLCCFLCSWGAAPIGGSARGATERTDGQKIGGQGQIQEQAEGVGVVTIGCILMLAFHTVVKMFLTDEMKEAIIPKEEMVTMRLGLILGAQRASCTPN